MFDMIQKVTVYVQDQALAKEFWTQKLGWTVALEMPLGPGFSWLEVKPVNDAQTAIVLYPKAAMLAHKPELVQHPGLILGTTDIESLHSNLLEKDVDADPIENQPWGKMFSFRDPDGNVYMVRQ